MSRDVCQEIHYVTICDLLVPIHNDPLRIKKESKDSCHHLQLQLPNFCQVLKNSVFTMTDAVSIIQLSVQLLSTVMLSKISCLVSVLPKNSTEAAILFTYLTSC